MSFMDSANPYMLLYGQSCIHHADPCLHGDPIAQPLRSNDHIRECNVAVSHCSFPAKENQTVKINIQVRN